MVLVLLVVLALLVLAYQRLLLLHLAYLLLQLPNQLLLFGSLLRGPLRPDHLPVQRERGGHLARRPVASGLAREHEDLRGGEDVLQGLQVLLRELEAQGVLAAAAGPTVDGAGDALEGLADAPGFLEDLGGVALAVKDARLLDALGDVDLGLALALGVEDLGALDALALGLQLHGAPDLVGRLDVLDLVAHALDAPLD